MVGSLLGWKKKQHLTRVTTPGWSTCRKVQVVTNKLTGGMDPSFREERFEFRKGFRRRIRCLGESSFNLSTSAIIRWQVLHVTWAGSFFFKTLATFLRHSGSGIMICAQRMRFSIIFFDIKRVDGLIEYSVFSVCKIFTKDCEWKETHHMNGFNEWRPR